jgi:hypothetical protein
VIEQLRIYEIFEPNKAAFHALRDHAMEFAYVLEWADAGTKEHAWHAFMADEEWREIKRVTAAAHGELVGESEDRLLLETDYSPARRR